MIKNKIPFQQANKEKDSHYTTIGGVLVRISNHCTWMKIWENYFQINPKDKGKPILSIVFEDGDNTYTEECLFTLSPLRKPIKVTEYVYKSPLNKSQVTEIIQNLKLLLKGVEFTNPLEIGEKWDRVSVNPDFMNIETTLDKRAIPAGGHGADEILESKQHMNMKRTITESQLRDMIAESVKSVLNEIGNTTQGLGAVAQNVDRRTSQMNDVYRNNASTAPQKSKAMGKAFDASRYLGQAIQNALANGMSEQEIEQVLKQNMSQNYNPTYNNGTLTWNRR